MIRWGHWGGRNKEECYLCGEYSELEYFTVGLLGYGEICIDCINGLRKIHAKEIKKSELEMHNYKTEKERRQAIWRKKRDKLLQK